MLDLLRFLSGVWDRRPPQPTIRFEEKLSLFEVGLVQYVAGRYGYPQMECRAIKDLCLSNIGRPTRQTRWCDYGLYLEEMKRLAEVWPLYLAYFSPEELGHA